MTLSSQAGSPAKPYALPPDRSGDRASEQVIAALIQDYADARDDERYFIAMQATTLTLGLAALSLLGALANETIKAETHFPDALLVGAPLPILAVLAFIEQAGSQAILRSFYLRGLEREIRSRLGIVGTVPKNVMTPLTWSEIVSTQTSLSEGHKHSNSWFYRFMAATIFGILWIVFGGLVTFFATQVALPWKLVMAVIYIPVALVIFFDALRINAKGRRLFSAHVELATLRLADPRGLGPGPKEPRTPKPQGSRTLESYLVLPRPDDLVKVLYSIAGLGAAVLAGAAVGGAVSWVTALGYLVLVEILVYQSRYQWNDIRGAAEDEQSPASVSRGRLPGGLDSWKPSVGVILLRLYIVFVVAMIPGPGRGEGDRVTPFDDVVLLSVPAVYGLAIVYELARGWTRRKNACSRADLVLIFVLVGAGYPLRFLLGWAAFSATDDAPTLLERAGLADHRVWVAALGFWGLGLGLVCLTWILEGASYIDGRQDDVHGTPWQLGHVAAGKQHLPTLLRWTGVPLADAPSTTAVPVSGRTVPLIRDREWPRLSPWAVGAGIWLVCVSLVGGWLVGYPDVKVPVWGIVGCLVLLAPQKDVVRQGVAGLVVAGALCAQALAMHAGDLDHWLGWLRLLLIGVLALMSSLFYLFFWGSSYEGTRASAKHLVTALVGLGGLGMRFVLGLPLRPTKPQDETQPSPPSPH